MFERFSRSGPRTGKWRDSNEVERKREAKASRVGEYGTGEECVE